MADLENAALKLFVFIMSVNIGMYAIETSGLFPNLTFPETGATLNNIKGDFPSLTGLSDPSETVQSTSQDPTKQATNQGGVVETVGFIAKQIPHIMTYYSRILTFVSNQIVISTGITSIAILFDILNLVILLIMGFYLLKVAVQLGSGVLGKILGL